MKKLAFCFAALFPVVASQAADIPRIAISQLIEHPALDDTFRGIGDELAAQGFHSEKLHIAYETAQGSNDIAAQIAQDFVSDNPDVIIAIATPTAQASVAASQGKIPVVFAAVTDPIAAKLVSQWKKPGANVTGVSDKIQLDQHIKMIQRILPNLKRLGSIYNPNESNSTTTIEELKQYGKDHGLEIVLATANQPDDVEAAANSLVGKVDAIYITLDNTALNAFETIADVGVQHKIPVFASDASAVPRGAIASLSFDYQDVGHLAGQQVVRILKGEKAGDIDVVSPKNVKFVVNVEAAKKVGITLPADVLKEAEQAASAE